jgi:hypothetical protein
MSKHKIRVNQYAGVNPEQARNARLMTAASDLLEVCQRAVHVLRGEIDLQGVTATEDSELSQTYEQMKAAIRKATGES